MDRDNSGRDGARKAAEAAGLRRLTDADLDLLAKSLHANQVLRARLPGDLHWSEEPAHVFRLTANAETGK